MSHIILKSSFAEGFVFNFFFFSAALKRAGVFKFLRFEKRFRKVPFLWRISVGDGPNFRVSHYNLDVI